MLPAWSRLVVHSLDFLYALEHADRAFDSRVDELLGVLDPTDVEWAREVSHRINVLDGLVERVGLRLFSVAWSPRPVVGDALTLVMSSTRT